MIFINKNNLQNSNKVHTALFMELQLAVAVNCAIGTKNYSLQLTAIH